MLLFFFFSQEVLQNIAANLNNCVFNDCGFVLMNQTFMHVCVVIRFERKDTCNVCVPT